MNDLELNLRKLSDCLVAKKAEKNQLDNLKNEIEDKINKIDIKSLEKSNIVLQTMSELQRQKACSKLQELCTYALQYSLSPNYEMEIELTKQRGKPAAEIYIKKTDSNTRTSPLEGNGGGVVDIISMALRIVTMQVHSPFIDGPIILDEPYKMVSKEYLPMISDFMKKLSDDFNRQIILCTHNEFLSQIADKKIIVTMGKDNESMIEEVNGGV